MTKGLIGKKLGMTRLFSADGASIPVTVIEAGPNQVLQIKTQERDGYAAAQLAFGHRRHPNKPALGHSGRAGFEGQAFKVVREFKMESPDLAAGQTVTLSV
ncbi:MAG: 50S ribosomal protein L3, partial [Deltaproteobacteria bacterium]|nr:50S ribosomal protein L3 [Deltaproteobacteria bacterium]